MLHRRKTLRYIPVHEIVGKISAQAFPFFHALSGCDTTSSVSRREKKTFYEKRKLMPEAFELFVKLSTIKNSKKISEKRKLLDKLFVLLCCVTINNEMESLFGVLLTQGGRSLKTFPYNSGFERAYITYFSRIIYVA